MKKFFLGIALLTIMLVVATGFKEERTSNCLEIGSLIPSSHLSNENNSIDVGQKNERFTLITFWESADAATRMDCNNYDKMFKTNPDLNKTVQFVAVNLDDSKALFDEIVRIDGLDANRQYHIEGNECNRIRETYGLVTGLGSVLVAPDGEIIAVNPSPETLKALDV